MKQKIKESIIPTFLLVFTLLGFGTAELYMTQKSEFWFAYSDMSLEFFLIGFITFLLLSVMLTVLPEKWHLFGIALSYGIGIAMYIQGNYLPNNYGSLNGEVIDWSSFKVRGIVGSCVWIGVIFIILVCTNVYKKKCISVLQVITVIILATQMVTLGIEFVIGTPEKQKTNQEFYLSTEGEFALSSKHNTVVLLLDCFDAQLMSDLIEEFPDIKETFSDFSFYKDIVGAATRTKYALPAILTGKVNLEGNSYTDYVNNASKESLLYQKLKSDKYISGIYTYDAFVSADQSDAIDNMTLDSTEPSSSFGLAKTFLKLTAFRYAPQIIKQNFWMYSGDFNQWKGSISMKEPFVENDIKFYSELCEGGLSVVNDKNTFRFYHLSGAHGPYIMDENCNRIDEGNGTEKAQALGSLKIVEKYIDELKRLDIYQNTDIIIMSDHGYNLYSKYEQNPLFMINDQKGGKELSVSDIRLSYFSLQEMFVASLEEKKLNMSEYEWTGERYFYIGSESANTTTIIEMVSKGKAYDSSEMYQTDNSYKSEDTSREYKLGTKIYFSEKDGCTAKPYYRKGLNYVETNYTWTDGKTVEMEFEIDTIGKELQVELYFDNIYKNSQRLTIFANEIEVFSDIITEPQTLSFTLPDNCIEDKELILKLYLPDASSPKEDGTGVDGRVLGITLHDMTISEK